ncbi:hypothetical protein ACWC10_05995 [Streptomyces sp. NPDC001595]|uniref:hypothetical protein n=1 Tax=Streptomyces sp. NPDC001532 TaxID=3154520 RepID=UPI003332C1FC
MTNAYDESFTERIPGRAWTIRIIGHGSRAASVTCSTAACRMPPRSEDLAALRAFAAAHAAAHAKAATVNPNAYCHCGSQRCGAHPDTKTSCAGGVVLILRHDPLVRRVWSVEEVCETCAPLIANVTVLARAARPARTVKQTATPNVQVPAPARPAIAGGFSSPPGDGDAPPARRPRRAPQRPRSRRSGQGR